MSASSLILLLSTATVATVPNPRSSGEWVSDGAHLMTGDERARMNTRLDALEKDLGVEIAVVTVDDVEADSTPKELATALFNQWGVGKRGRDNGLLVLLVMKRRRLEMETGYGLEAVLPDAWLGTMQTRVMVPLFRQGTYVAGLEAGLERIDARLRERASDIGTSARGADDIPQRLADDSAPADGADERSLAAPLSVLAIGLGAVGVGLWIRRRRRTCKSCGVLMQLLDEQQDDQHLSAGQRTEERLRSVNYDVYQCARCQALRVFEKRRWFSGHVRCSACGFRTSHRQTRTITAPSVGVPGLAEITESCGHCGTTITYNRTLPALSSSSSSGDGWSSSSSSGGGSSGGSFGGGSSGGGGAGSSW